MMITVLLVTPVLVSLLLAACGCRIAASLPPCIAVVGLAATALISALSMGFALSVLGLQAVAQLEPVARYGHWSATTIGSSDPLPAPMGALAGALALALLIAGTRQGWLAAREVATASAVCRQLGPDAGGLVVLQDEHADAFTLPGLPHGRIVVSTSMFRVLDAAERRALLAHETAHLRRRHHVFVQVVDIAAAANPLLRPLRAEVRIGVERWADEYAVHCVGDRRVVARALARAGLERARTGSFLDVPGALAIAETALSRRVDALMTTAPRRRPALALLLAALVLVLMAASLATDHSIDARFDRASAVYELHAHTR
jgi:Zn-dependent protease with chaperone function